MFDFRRLVEKYSSPVIVFGKSEGHYDYEQGGKWVEGTEQPREIMAAVMQLSSNDLDSLEYTEGGVYTRQDRKIYLYEPLKIGMEIEHKECRYKTSDEADYSDVANGLYVYYMRRVERL